MGVYGYQVLARGSGLRLVLLVVGHGSAVLDLVWFWCRVDIRSAERDVKTGSVFHSFLLQHSLVVSVFMAGDMVCMKRIRVVS